MSAGKAIIRVGALLIDALYVVVIGEGNEEKTETIFHQSAATRFDDLDAARAAITRMHARGDSWAAKARPVRLSGTRVVHVTKSGRKTRSDA